MLSLYQRQPAMFFIADADIGASRSRRLVFLVISVLVILAALVVPMVVDVHAARAQLVEYLYSIGWL